MAEQSKTKVTRVVISPELRERIDIIREREHRNITNAVEVLLLEALAAREGGNK